MDDVYTTPIKASVQAAGYLREDFRNLDHEEPVLEQYKITSKIKSVSADGNKVERRLKKTHFRLA